MDKDKDKGRYGAITNLWYLFKLGWRYDKKLYFLSLVEILFSSIFPFIGILFPKYIIDELTGERSAERIMIILVVFFILLIAFNLMIVFLKSKINPRFTVLRFKFVREFSKKCMFMDFEKTEDPSVLDMVHMASRAVAGNFDGIEGLYRKMFSFISEAVTFIGILSMVFYLNWIILIYLLASCIAIYFVKLRVKKFERENEEKLALTDRKKGYVSGLFNDNAYGKEIRLFGIHKWVVDKYSELVNERITHSEALRKKNFVTNLINILFLLVREGIMYAYLVSRFLGNTVSIGDFTMYFGVINRFTGQIQGMLDSFAFVRFQNMYVNDYRCVIEMERDHTEYMADPEELPQAPFTIEFRNVSFKYPNSNELIIKNFSYKFKSGERIALVGHNGAGKTTLIKLMTRLYDPTEGEILLNGINIKMFNREEYFDLFSALYQDFKVFAFSVNENIALCNEEEINYDFVNENLEKVGLNEKIENLPKKGETSLLKALDYEGVELSGGENQKLALARALYKDGNIFIMDEPTAAMDPLAEYNFYKLLNQMSDENNIYLFISHRLASTRFCDNILLLENGEIKETGAHSDLIERQGEYYRLFEMQAENYRRAV